MKLPFHLFILFPSFFVQGQENIMYEQIAWEFYNDELFEKSNSKKMKFWGPLSLNCTLYYDSACARDMDFDISNTNQRFYEKKGIVKFSYTNGDRYRVRDSGSRGYPSIYIIMAFSNKVDQQIVTIVESYKTIDVLYHIDLTDDGKVKNWCKGSLSK